MRHIKLILGTVVEEFQKYKCIFDHSPVDDFFKSQWQNQPRSIVYLIYRWIIGLFFIAVVIDSVIDNGYEDASLYLIYLTNWGVLMCMFTTLLGAIGVSFWYFHTEYANKTIAMNSLTKTLKMYWGIHIITTILSIVITIVYWSILYKSTETELTATNILTHAFNAIVMFLDLLIVAHPVRLLHMYLPVLFGMSFVVFSYIYHIFGGINKKQQPFIYSVLDWNNPAEAISTVICVLILTCFVHFWVFVIYKLRTLVYKRVNGRSLNLSTTTKCTIKDLTREIIYINVESAIFSPLKNSPTDISLVFGSYKVCDKEVCCESAKSRY